MVRSNPGQYINNVEMVDPGVVTKITGRAFVAGGKPVKVKGISVHWVVTCGLFRKRDSDFPLTFVNMAKVLRSYDLTSLNRS